MTSPHSSNCICNPAACIYAARRRIAELEDANYKLQVLLKEAEADLKEMTEFAGKNNVQSAKAHARIAELEAELQNPSGGWYCTDCGSADALVSITFRIAELEAVVVLARAVVDDSGCGRFLVAYDPERGDVECDTVEKVKLDALRERLYGRENPSSHD